MRLAFILLMAGSLSFVAAQGKGGGGGGSGGVGAGEWRAGLQQRSQLLGLQGGGGQGSPVPESVRRRKGGAGGQGCAGDASQPLCGVQQVP